MSYWKGAVVSLLTGVMIASSAIQPVAIYAETVLDEGGQADSAQDGSVQADGSESDRSTSDEPVDSESEASQDADEAPGSASIEMGEGAASTDGLAVAQDDASEAEESVAAEDASEANTMASRTLVENSWRYQNGQRIESLDDESAPSGDFLSRAMDPLPDGATAQGIDVSEFQGKIDWEAVKAAGVDFAILRIGYGDQNAGGTDKYFKRNVEECERLGIKWGAYLYSYSVNTNEAADEAAHVLSAMKGLTPDLPIYYDMEDDSTLGAKDRFADIAQTFCSKIEAAGYDAGVYASASWWKYYLTSSVFHSWSKWSAQYNDVCQHPSDPDAWQYTSEGRVPGISGNVDVNYAYEGLVPASVSEANQHVSTLVHVSDIGWQSSAALDGTVAGTVGKSKSIEALNISLVHQVKTGSVQVRAHVSQLGWQGWTSGTAGTTGRGLPVEAVQVRLTGEMAESYDVYYRVHAANIGWMGWARNGQEAGTQGYAYGVEAVQVLLVPKGGQPPSSSGSATPEAFRRRPVDVSVRAHVSQLGWRGAVRGGATAGTTGRALAVEALQVGLTDQQLAGSVQVRAHVSNVGWQDWTSGTAGTTGRGLPIEAVQVRLTGEKADSYDVYYRVHAANIGWMGWARDGDPAGTVGMSYAVEAVQVKLVAKGSAAPGSTSGAYRGSQEQLSGSVSYLSGTSTGSGKATTVTLGSERGGRISTFALSVDNKLAAGSLQYRALSQFGGWGAWVSEGSAAGASGDVLKGVSLKLSGDLASSYDIWYQVYDSDAGWLGWASNGTEAGSTGTDSHAVAVRVTLVKKGSSAPGSTSNAYVQVSYDTPHITIQAHSANVGWQDPVREGASVGVTGKALSLQAVRAIVSGPVSGDIQISSHVSNIGWQNWVNGGTISGTTGKNLPIEAIRIKLTGELADSYSVYYRVHSAEYGWLGWAHDGSDAGTVGTALQAEAIEIRLVKKRSSDAPTSDKPAAVFKPTLTSQAHVSNKGWLSSTTDGMVGTTGQALSLEALKLSVDSSLDGGIAYSAHVQDIGWQSEVSDGSLAGTTGKGKHIEAVKIRLTGTLSQYFDVWYRAHSEEYGWLGWTKNGEQAGTSKLGYRLEAVQIRILPKGSAAPGSTYKQFTDKPIVPADQLAMKNRANAYGSRTPWLIMVNTTTCRVGIYRGSKGMWQQQAYWVCSVGAPLTPTVLGEYTVGIKGYVFGRGYSCYYYTQFYGDYLFHTIKYDQGTFNVQDGRLGEHVSEGCVRLSFENAKWIWDNIPTGTKVVTYE